MKRSLRVLTLLAMVAAASCAVVAQPQSERKAQAARTLEEGLQAFANGGYPQAVKYFESAIGLDPDLPNADLHLARAYARQFVPGTLTEENGQLLRAALESFERHLKREPDNVEAVLAIASLHQSSNDFIKAREYYLRATVLAPQTPAPFYGVGSINWYIVYDKNSPRPLDEQKQLVNEGLQKLDTVIAIDPQHSEAMTYQNLLLREKARLTDDPAEKASLIAKADEWFNRALAARQTRAQARQALIAPGGQSSPPPPPPFLPIASAQSPGRTGAGSVSGRLTYEDGSPAASTIVTAVAVTAPTPGGTRTIARALTDSSGEYRLDNLPVGSYHIEAGFPGMGVYYPGTRVVDKAVAITVGSAETAVVGVDFTYVR